MMHGIAQPRLLADCKQLFILVLIFMVFINWMFSALMFQCFSDCKHLVKKSAWIFKDMILLVVATEIQFFSMFQCSLLKSHDCFSVPICFWWNDGVSVFYLPDLFFNVSVFQYCFRRQVALSDFQSQLALDSPMAMYSKVDRQQDYNSSKLQARHKVQVLYLID